MKLVPTLLCSALLSLSGAGWSTEVAAPPPAIQNFAADVMQANDAAGKAFGVIDKPRATLWIFDARGKLLDRSPVLVGQARGDVAPADIGTRPLSKIRPHEKITASGRFVTEAGRNLSGEDIVWLDYDSAMSLHRVRNVPGENRVKRLATEDVADNRISFGCVNIPADFYDRHIKPLFGTRPGVVYVLPESKTLSEVFPFAVDAHKRPRIR
ncbi:MAG: L,D-transpeptidase [Comamonadaceae bacterium]|nr:L,D-transpeptidase [Comamonadaceae bacterium]